MLGLAQIIQEFSRVTSTTQTMIDLIFTDSMYILRSGVIEDNMSDHFPIYFVRKKERGFIKKKEIMGRSYKDYDKIIFQNLLQHAKWDKFDTETDPDILWDIFDDNIRAALDLICPIRKLTIPEDKPKWLTADIINLIRDRDALYKRA